MNISWWHKVMELSEQNDIYPLPLTNPPENWWIEYPWTIPIID